MTLIMVLRLKETTKNKISHTETTHKGEFSILAAPFVWQVLPRFPVWWESMMPHIVPVCIQYDFNIMSVYITVLCGNVTYKRKKNILNWKKKIYSHFHDKKHSQINEGKNMHLLL